MTCAAASRSACGADDGQQVIGVQKPQHAAEVLAGRNDAYPRTYESGASQDPAQDPDSHAVAEIRLAQVDDEHVWLVAQASRGAVAHRLGGCHVDITAQGQCPWVASRCFCAQAGTWRAQPA